jgi:hypothetical protein
VEKKVVPVPISGTGTGTAKLKVTPSGVRELKVAGKANALLLNGEAFKAPELFEGV